VGRQVYKVFDQISEKGDTDQTTKLQKENRQLTERVEMLEREYEQLKNGSEFIIDLIKTIDTEYLRRKFLEKRQKELEIHAGPPSS
jgi:cell division protein FtsB